MNSARKKVLAGIRSALQQSDRLSPDPVKSEQYLTAHRRGVVANVDGDSHEDLVASFIDRAEKLRATVTTVESLAEVCECIAKQMQQYNLGNSLRVSTEAIISQIDWSRTPDLVVVDGAAVPEDKVSLTGCLCGIAETGSLVLLSSRKSPSTLKFLPEMHMVLITSKQIVAVYEDAWDLIRQGEAIPRTVNFITGPSCTGDIEQKLLMGMHGPAKLNIILYKDLS